MSDVFITPATWLKHLSKEYLDSFVCEGGAAVKFTVPQPAARDQLLNGLNLSAKSRGYIHVTVSAETTKAHMADQVFFAIAENLPWRKFARDALKAIAVAEGLTIPMVDDYSRSYAEILAEVNGLDIAFIKMQMTPKISHNIYKNHELLRDFRVAMTHMCLAELSGGPEGVTKFNTLEAWLSGKVTAVAALKPYSVYIKINRSNARSFLESTLRWIRFSQNSGLVITLDIDRIGVARNPRDGKIYYSKVALLDMYEMLRQFIDGTDKLKSCLFVVVAPPEFLDVSTRTRGMSMYEALKFRVYDEVRSRNLVNPMGALVRLDNDILNDNNAEEVA